jgi:hypothetical protein
MSPGQFFRQYCNEGEAWDVRHDEKECSQGCDAVKIWHGDIDQGCYGR